jgi:hypothetical protein
LRTIPGLLKEIGYLYRRHRKIIESACRELEEARARVQELIDYALDLHHLRSCQEMLQIAPPLPLRDEYPEAIRVGEVGFLPYVLNIDLTSIFYPDLTEYLPGPGGQGNESNLLDRSHPLTTSNTLTHLEKIGENVVQEANLTGLVDGSLTGFPQFIQAALVMGATVGFPQSDLADLEDRSLIIFPQFIQAALVEGIELGSGESEPTFMDGESKAPWNSNVLRTILNFEENIHKKGRVDRKALMEDQISSHPFRSLTTSQEGLRTWISEGREIRMEIEDTSAAFSQAIYSTLEMNKTGYLQDPSGQSQRDISGEVSATSYFPKVGSRKARNLGRIRDAYADTGEEERSKGRSGSLRRRVIEVPTLSPQERFSHIEESSAKRVSRIWDALQHQENETNRPGREASKAVLESPAISLPQLYRILTDSLSSLPSSALPSSIFSTDPIQRSEELKSIRQFMCSALEMDEVNENALKVISEEAINMSSEKSISPHLSSDHIIYPLAPGTDNEVVGEGGRLSVAQCMAVTRSLPRIVADEAIFRGMSPGEAIQMPTFNIPPNISSSYLQILSQGKSGEVSRASGGNTFHLNNHFNIAINARVGEETELRELGRKIGIILSEEIRRYGGMG